MPIADGRTKVIYTLVGALWTVLLLFTGWLAHRVEAGGSTMDLTMEHRITVLETQVAEQNKYILAALSRIETEIAKRPAVPTGSAQPK